MVSRFLNAVKKADVSFTMIVFAILMLLVIALVAYFVWDQFLRSAEVYTYLQNQTTRNLSWLDTKP